MKLATALLALILSGVITIHAQDQAVTANETAYKALEESAKDAAPTTPQANKIANDIIAGSAITQREIQIINKVNKSSGDAVYREALRTIAASNKKGKGVLVAQAQCKVWDRDTSGWTPEMIAAKVNLAAALAWREEAPPKFKEKVWTTLLTQSAHAASCRKFFKQYRATLPKAEQLEATRKQKDLVLAIPERNDEANAWLAEMSADLIALQLDTAPTP